MRLRRSWRRGFIVAFVGAVVLLGASWVVSSATCYAAMESARVRLGWLSGRVRDACGLAGRAVPWDGWRWRFAQRVGGTMGVRQRVYWIPLWPAILLAGLGALGGWWLE